MSYELLCFVSGQYRLGWEVGCNDHSGEEILLWFMSHHEHSSTLPLPFHFL